MDNLMDKTVRTSHASGTRPVEEICNLPNTEREDRIAAFRRNILPLATKRQVSADGATLDFQYSATLEKQLEELVALERVCCSDLNWDLNRSQANVLSLGISEIPPNCRFFADIKKGEVNPQPSSGLATRLAQSLGLGSAAAAILCCVAPMTLAAVTGVTVAAPLARLDSPLMIVAGSLALSIPVWLWLKRRDARSSSCGC